ncbi:MAG: PEP-CTERM sorting domain-containing protein [Verrucomicrobiales bacterium]
MKKTFFSSVLLAGLAPWSLAAVIVQDGFDDGGYGNGADPLDLDWSNIPEDEVRNTAPQPATGNYFAIDSRGNHTQRRGFLPVSSLLDLQVGQTLTLSFKLNYEDAPGDNAAGFRFGLMGASGNRFGVGAVAGTGASTVLDLRYDQVNSDDDYFGGSNADNNRSYSGSVNAAMSSGLSAGTNYDVSLVMARDATGMTISTSLNGGSSEVTILESDAGFYTDFSGGVLVIRAGGVNADFNIDDVQITVVPEPGGMLLLGLGGLLGLRRRR